MSARGPLADAPLPMMEVRLASRVITDVSNPLTALTGFAREELIGSDPARLLADSPNPALPLLVSGKICGYEAMTTLRRADGHLTDVHVWAHILDPQQPPQMGLMVIDDESTPGVGPWTPAVEPLAVMGTVDANWRIDRITQGVEA